MKIQWKNIYYPIGGWFDENGDRITKNLGNFRCLYDGLELICVMVSKKGSNSQGDPSITASTPEFFDEETLSPVKIDGFVDAFHI